MSVTFLPLTTKRGEASSGARETTGASAAALAAFRKLGTLVPARTASPSVGLALSLALPLIIPFSAAAAAPEKASPSQAGAACASLNQGGPAWNTVERLLRGFSEDFALTRQKGKGAASAGHSQPSQIIDYQEMSVRALGRRQWETLSTSQKRDFSASLEALVEKRYYPRWRKIFGKGKVTFVEETGVGGDTLVKTRLTLGKKVETLAWRLTDKGTRVISLSVSDKDLLERLKSRINSRCKKGKLDVDQLIAWMRNSGGETQTSLSVEGASLAVSQGSTNVVAD
ncbi:MAG TPA: ABC transporter substrate-binding protein [Candidatus Obscuribacter sp.]|nr:ABC transporter substrate-binding protein [Candidatus Obscuribacter sp.]